MTEATAQRPAAPKAAAPQLTYRVAMPAPAEHLFAIAIQIDGWTEADLDLKFPVWTPGSYLVREYARHLQDFVAETADGTPLAWEKRAKNHWRVAAGGTAARPQTVVVRYRLFANDLTVRTNHLDASHGYFNGAATFFYLPGWQHLPIAIAVALPDPHWQATTALPKVAGGPQEQTFRAANFDELVDSPFEVGEHATHSFEAGGKLHQLAIWGRGNADAEDLIPDFQKIIETEAALFGELPYDRYLFLLHLSASGYGGLEHKNCCSLNYPRFGFRDRDKRDRFLQLVAHEFFHLWNVKRIRPKALERFDYDRENYTPSLWFSEGTTSYYDLLIPLRAGVCDRATFLKSLAKDLTRYWQTPGRQVQPLQESSFDAWVKLYRSEAHSGNHQISYYLKGELVSLLLDLRIRERHNHRRSLDDAMRQMWQRFGREEIGFTPEELEATIADAAGEDLTDFFRRYLDTTEELPLAEALESFGLAVRAEPEEGPPTLGLRLQAEGSQTRVKFVEAGSPAHAAGLDPGDELLALDGVRLAADQLADRLKDYQPGDRASLTWFHQDELREAAVVLGDRAPARYELVPIAEPSESQRRNLEAWLGGE